MRLSSNLVGFYLNYNLCTVSTSPNTSFPDQSQPNFAIVRSLTSAEEWNIGMDEALAEDGNLHEGPKILSSMDLHDSQAPPHDHRVSIAHLLAVIKKFNFDCTSNIWDMTKFTPSP